MGFTGEAPPREQVLTVATVNGRVSALGEQFPKARVWLLEDRSVVLCVPDRAAPGRVRRVAYGPVVSAAWDKRAKALSVTVALGEDMGEGTITVDARGCGCGMGAAGNAGPTAGKFDVVRVRTPEWYTVTV
jgi:hypothetical protein